MNVKGEQYAQRLFNALDEKSTGTITTDQLIDTLVALKNGTVEEKIAFIWSYISSEKQHITRDELKLLLKVNSQRYLEVRERSIICKTITRKTAIAAGRSCRQQETKRLYKTCLIKINCCICSI